MKTNLLNAIALAVVMTTCYNCSVEPMDNLQTETSELSDTIAVVETTAMTCNGSDPKAKIVNNGTLPADYQIYDASGTTIVSVIGLMPGTASNWVTFPEGMVVFNVEMASLTDQKVGYTMATCTELTLEINSNNQLTDAQPQTSVN